MTDPQRPNRGFLALLLDAGILVTGMVRGLLGKPGRPPEDRRGAPLQSVETEKDVPQAPSSGDPWADAEREIAARTFPEHFTIRPHWSEPQPASLPALTYAPATMALGIVIFALGLITRWYVAVVGGAIFARAIWIWVGDLTNERSDRDIDGL